MGQKSVPWLPAVERSRAMFDGQCHHWGWQDFALFTTPSTEATGPTGESP